ncbi:unnamed protein product, partial [Choristocarpus tenellus]
WAHNQLERVCTPSNAGVAAGLRGTGTPSLPCPPTGTVETHQVRQQMHQPVTPTRAAGFGNSVSGRGSEMTALHHQQQHQLHQHQLQQHHLQRQQQQHQQQQKQQYVAQTLRQQQVQSTPPGDVPLSELPLALRDTSLKVVVGAVNTLTKRTFDSAEDLVLEETPGLMDAICSLLDWVNPGVAQIADTAAKLRAKTSTGDDVTSLSILKNAWAIGGAPGRVVAVAAPPCTLYQPGRTSAG